MAFTATSTIQDLNLGKLTKILQKGAIYPQLATQSAFWKKVLSKTEGQAKGREQRFEVLTGRGPASFQFAGQNGDFPDFQASEIVEGVVNWKDFDLNISYDLVLQDKTGEDLYSYARPYALEMQSKGVAAARALSAAAMGDGSGVIGVVTSVAVNTTTDKITVVLNTSSANADRSHPAWFEDKDLVKFASDAGAAKAKINNNATDVASWRVVSVNQDTATIVLEALSAAGAVIDLTDATVGAGDPTAAHVIYRKNTTANDLTAISTNDYNSISQVFAGMGSLSAADGRKVNGLTMSGVLSGSRRDVDGALLSSRDFQKLLSKIMRATSGETNGQKLTYSDAMMHDVVYDVLVEQNEANRTWFNIQDPSSGISRIGHRHRKQFVEFIEDEFAPFQRIYLCPDQKGPISFLGTDLKEVKVGGTSECLKAGSTTGCYAKTAIKFMSGSGALMTSHPAAIGCVENFSITA